MTMGLVLVACIPPKMSSAQVPTRDVPSTCRPNDGTATGSSPRRRVSLPQGDLFAPLVADAKEPNVSVSYRRVQFRDAGLPAGAEGPGIDAAVVSAGGTFGLWASLSGDSCRGVQLSVLGGIFSQFNLDAPSLDLINSDFVVGTQVSVRQGRFSERLRIYHQSSHLGDEFVLRNPAVHRIDFGFMAIHGLISYEHDWWRVYGGGGYLFYQTSGLSPGLLQGGVEFSPSQSTARSLRPIAGLDVTSLQARGWGVTATTSAGVEWTSGLGLRRMRALVFGATGYVPFGQFTMQERIRAIGLQLHIGF